MVSLGLFVALLVGSAALAPSFAYATEAENDKDVQLEVSYDPADGMGPTISTRSWYGSTLTLGKYDTSFKGATRYYNGQHVGIEMTCKTKGATSGKSKYFSVELHRKNGLVDTYIGSAAFKRKGFTKATWTNVGSGNYYFKFVRTSDGQSIHSNDVKMYSWK